MNQKYPVTLKEERELQFLAPNAAKSSESRGRIRKERPCTVRTVYERDAGRIIYSPEFRRLRHKTQVFFTTQNDHICTRLEHVLYVNYISKTIGRALGLNNDLIEAIALAHDIGHAPFGHKGEAELQRLLQAEDDSFFFHHELHGLRIVDILSRRGENKAPGLNLSFEVRDGIVSHCGETYDEIGLKPEKNKPSENLAKYMRERIRKKQRPAPATFEGCVVRFADKIAYVGRDLEDAKRAGIISYEDLSTEIKEELGITNGDIINSLVLDLIENSNEEEIAFSPAKAEALEELLQFSYQNIYKAAMVKTYEELARQMVAALFTHYYALSEDLEKNIAENKAPKNIRELRNRDFLLYYEKHPDKASGRLQITCDYLAGMTDNYASAAFNDLFQL